MQNLRNEVATVLECGAVFCGFSVFSAPYRIIIAFYICNDTQDLHPRVSSNG